MPESQQENDDWLFGEEKPQPPKLTEQLTYEEEERIAIQQEGCGRFIDRVLRYPVE